MTPNLPLLLGEAADDTRRPDPDVMAMVRIGRRARRVRGAVRAAAVGGLVTVAAGVVAVVSPWTSNPAPAAEPSVPIDPFTVSAHCKGDGPMAVRLEDEIGWTNVALDGSTTYICAGGRTEASDLSATYWDFDLDGTLSDDSITGLGSELCFEPCDQMLRSVVGVLPPDVSAVTYHSADGTVHDAVLGDRLWAVRVIMPTGDLPGYEWKIDDGLLTVTPKAGTSSWSAGSAYDQAGSWGDGTEAGAGGEAKQVVRDWFGADGFTLWGRTGAEFVGPLTPTEVAADLVRDRGRGSVLIGNYADVALLVDDVGHPVGDSEETAVPEPRCATPPTRQSDFAWSTCDEEVHDGSTWWLATGGDEFATAIGVTLVRADGSALSVTVSTAQFDRQHSSGEPHAARLGELPATHDDLVDLVAAIDDAVGGTAWEVDGAPTG